MSKSLILSFNSAVAKYSRLSNKVRKSINRGEFWRFTRHKRHQLLSKIERLRRRIAELRLQLKLAGAGLAAGLMVMASPDANAQKTTLGPFVENQRKNPFPPTAFERRVNPVVTFFDMDDDGDQDASLQSQGYGYATFYQNVGDDQNPTFKSFYQSGLDLYNYSGGARGRVAYADIDSDGDLDAVVGMSYSDTGDDSLPDDVVYFFRNITESPIPYFSYVEGSEHPFASMHIKKEGWPAFTDYDKDGDLDFVLAGEYDDKDTGKTAWIQFFRNDTPSGQSGDPIYTQLQGTTGTLKNPLYLGESAETITAGYFDIAFADLDGDGDDDYFAADQHGTIFYKRNDNGVFTEQEGAYTFKAAGASTGNPMSITGLNVAGPDQAKSLAFADLDGDGDLDAVLGTNAVGTLNSPYIYAENTGNGVMVVDQTFSNPITGINMGDNTTATFFDVDNDGDEDFLTTGVVDEPIGSEGLTQKVLGHLFFENVDGAYQMKTLLDDPFAALVVNGSTDVMLTADVDGDSDLDAIIVGYEYDSDIESTVVAFDYMRNDNGTFVPVADNVSPLKNIRNKDYYGMDINFGDLDGDGLPDAVVIGGSTPPVFFKNTGTEFVQEDSWGTGLSTEISGLVPKLVDVDNDGDNDLVLGKYFYIWYYQNIGTPTQPAWVEYQQHYGSGSDEQNAENPFGDVVNTSSSIFPEVADVDGDGDKDLFYTQEGRGNFIFYENQNPAPTVVIGGNTNFPVQVGTAITLAPQLTIEDEDEDKIVRITAQVTPFKKGQDKLTLNGTHGTLTSTWDDDIGLLTIEGTDTITVFQEALRAIQYTFTASGSGRKSGNGRVAKTVNQTITITALDADVTVAPSNTAVFTVTGDDGTGPDNRPPVIDAPGKKSRASGNIAISISSVISDPDNNLDLTTLQASSQQGAMVTITGNIITVDYSGIPTFEGTDVITVTVCDTDGLCTTSTFNVEVSATAYIYTGMSPNGDGINDWFWIDFLPEKTHVAIYNRWGDLIFEEKDYNMDDPAKRFEGKNKNGNDVIAGSYYYKVKYPDGTVKTGYLLLNR